MPLSNLIEQAGSIEGSEYQLAHNLNLTPQRLSDYKHGRKPCPPDIQAVLAAKAGSDAVDALISAIGERLSPDRRAQLAKALGRKVQKL